MKRKILFVLGSLFASLMVGCSQNNTSFNSQSSIEQTPNTTEAIEIKTEEDLIAIRSNLNNNYILKNDIYLTKPWQTIGNSENPFAGTLNGDGFSIYNMNVVTNEVTPDDTSIEYMVGMFGVLTGKIKNVTFENYKVSINKTSITNTNYYSLLSSNTKFENLDIHVGLVGLNKGNITDVAMVIDYDIIPETTTSRIRIGGIAGKSSDKIARCYVEGNIDVTNKDGYIRAGGIAGYVSSNGEISDNQSATNLTLKMTDEAKINAGGLIGNIECGFITNSLSSGKVTVTNTNNKASLVGGLVGLIDNTDPKYDDMSVEILSSYSTSDVTVTGAKGYGAGFIGQVDFESNNVKGNITIKDNACSGSVKGSKGTYGFIGRLQTALGTLLNKDNFVDGSYGNGIVLITGNKSVIKDDFATQVSEIDIPDSFN